MIQFPLPIFSPSLQYDKGDSPVLGHPLEFVLAQAAVSHGMELLLALITVGQGMVSTIMTASGLSSISDMTVPAEMVTIIESVGFLESIPLWAVTLLGSLVIWVLSLVMILTVYSRFFKIYMATDQPNPISSRMSRSLILTAPTNTSMLKITSPT